MKDIALVLFFSLIVTGTPAAQYSLKKTMHEIERLFQKNHSVDEISLYYDKIAVNLDSVKNRKELFELNKKIAGFLQEIKKSRGVIKFFKNSLMYTDDIKNKIQLSASLATCYDLNIDQDEALIYVDMVIKKSEENKYYHAPSLIKVYKIKAKIYQMEGDIKKAVSWYKKAQKIIFSEFGNRNIEFANIYIRLGECYDLSGDYEKALAIKKKGIEIAQSIPNIDPKTYSLFYRSFGLSFQKKGEYYSAIKTYNKAISVLKSNDTTSISSILGVIGNCYYYLEESEKAISYFLSATRMLGRNKSKLLISENLAKAGASYTNLGRYAEAAVLIDSALATVKFDERKSLPFEQIISSKPSLLITLYFKAKNSLQLYLKYGCEEDLEQAHKDYDVCIRLIDHIISSFDDSDSKQYLVDRFYYIFESIIEVNYQLYKLHGDRKYVDRAMRYMEKSRSILLKEMMQQAKAGIMAGIPDTVLVREHRLREQIAVLESRKYESERKLPSGQMEGDLLHQLNDSLFILREQYWALLKQMEQRFPNYYDLKHADRSAETAAIVNRLLLSQEALLQYFVGDDHIYTLVYRGDGAFVMTKTSVGSLDQDIKALREHIYGYVLTPADSLVRAYADGAYGLYEKLLQPIRAYLPYRVMVIPDGLLEYLPFEALLTAKADLNSSFRNWPYCLRQYSFSYAHSVLSLEEMRQRQNRPKYRQVLAIAPSFSAALAVGSPDERRRSFGALEDNLAEVVDIGELFPTKTLVGPEATVESFKALAGDYAVLHLATHAKADNENGEYAYVAFSETNDTAHSNLLYLKNLYTIVLNADMVALSACETGVGKLRRGEGVVSLARGFSYAGANSLVTTLWRISDRESATLMQRYYRGLKNDLPKDEALRQAKINYLDEASGNRAHPFFWAAFVTIGDMEPLDLPDGEWVWWLVAGLLALLAVGYWGWRKLQGGMGKLEKGEHASPLAS